MSGKLFCSILLLATMCACAPATGGATPNPVASPTAVAPPIDKKTVAPVTQFRFRDDNFERLDSSSKVLWSVKMPAEPYRQLAVLGQTVLVWGPSNNLRRFDIESGRLTDLTLAPGAVSVFAIQDGIMVQGTETGLAGVGEKHNLWHRADLFTDSMVVGVGSADAPVVLLVQRKSGLARAVRLADGKDAPYSVPKGTFRSVVYDKTAGVVTWTPRVDGKPLKFQAADGKAI